MKPIPDNKNNLGRAVAVLQLAAAGELSARYLGDGTPFRPGGPILESWQVGKRFEVSFFNDCGCCDYLDSVRMDGELVWDGGLVPRNRYEDPMDYLTSAEQRSLEKLFGFDGLETIQHAETRMRPARCHSAQRELVDALKGLAPLLRADDGELDQRLWDFVESLD